MNQIKKQNTESLIKVQFNTEPMTRLLSANVSFGNGRCILSSADVKYKGSLAAAGGLQFGPGVCSSDLQCGTVVVDVAAQIVQRRLRV